jgi:hypothetical protein
MCLGDGVTNSLMYVQSYFEYSAYSCLRRGVGVSSHQEHDHEPHVHLDEVASKPYEIWTRDLRWALSLPSISR